MGCRRQWVRLALPAHTAALGKPCLRRSWEDIGDGSGAGAGLSGTLSCARLTACARR